MTACERRSETDGREPFTEWLDAVRDKVAQARIRVRLRQLQAGNFGDCEPVGEGVIELRVHVGAGYRVLAERLADQPMASIQTACRGWAETQAGYLFLAQEEIDWTEIMRPHWHCAAERMRQHPVVLCVQDTTDLDFNGQSIEGLGPLS